MRLSKVGSSLMGVLLSMGAILSIGGCLDVAIVDDQRIATIEDRAVVNPTPAARDFRGQNDRHKVLVAVLDTGVDYNHPLLLQNIHFSLDASGKPVALGRDLVGDDEWPAPYLARTSRYDTRLDGSPRAASMLRWANARLMVRAFPDLARFFHPSRNLAAEILASVEHGTHVAGLMVYDRPDIGLLAYRVLPHNRVIQKDAASAHDYSADLAQRIGAAVEAAVSDGARVINMSLGGDADTAAPEEHKKLKIWSEQLRKIVLRYPHALFVVAAGNAARWIDGATRVSYPCGVDAANVLCVGALRENGDLAKFTNVPLSGANVIFALGEKVLSTVPTNICYRAPVGVLERNDPSDDDMKRLADATREHCERSWFLERLTGTSMAAPLACHLAGEILAEFPDLPAADVIREMYRRSVHTYIGDYPVFKIRIKKPSWYMLEQGASPADDEVTRDRNDPNGVDVFEVNRGAPREPAYWDAYLPTSHEAVK